MSASLAQIWRHPIKAIGREALGEVTLNAGGWLPFDRLWAVAHARSKLSNGGWEKKVNFLRGVTDPGLMAITSVLDEASGDITLSHPGVGDIRVNPERDTAAFLAWIGRIWPSEFPAPTEVFRAEGVHMTDVPDPWVSIAALSSNAALSQRMSQDLAPERWRANLWLEATPAWAEKDWLGKEIRIGKVVLGIEQEITRCKATMANPATGRRDANTLAALNALGHQEFGLYASVVAGGKIRIGDAAQTP